MTCPPQTQPHLGDKTRLRSLRVTCTSRSCVANFTLFDRAKGFMANPLFGCVHVASRWSRRTISSKDQRVAESTARLLREHKEKCLANYRARAPRFKIRFWHDCRSLLFGNHAKTGTLLVLKIITRLPLDHSGASAGWSRKGEWAKIVTYRDGRNDCPRVQERMELRISQEGVYLEYVLLFLSVSWAEAASYPVRRGYRPCP